MIWKARYIPLAAVLTLAAIPVSAGDAKISPTDKAEKETVRVVVRNSEKGEKSTYLGVMLREETQNPEGGARVGEVLPDSPAAKAGLREDDIIVAFGDTAVRGPVGLTKRIRESKPGDKVPIEVLRDGKKQTIAVELGERAERHIIVSTAERGEEDITIPLPEIMDLEIEMRDLREHMPQLRKELKMLKADPRHGGGRGWAVFRGGDDRPRLGVELVDTTPDLREFLGGKREAGVLIGKVLAGTPAEKAGVRVGDLIVSVDGDAVEDSGDLIEAMSDKDGKTVDLEVVRDRKTLHLKVPIPEGAGDEPSGPRARFTPPELPEPPESPEPPEPPEPPAAVPCAPHAGLVPA